MRLLIFGAGYSGRAIARELSGEAEWIAGTTRSQENFAHLETAGVTPFVFDGATLSDALSGKLAEATHIVQSISPDGSGDPLLPLFAERLKDLAPKLVWAGYLSTVGVYGNHDGDWVDEDSECRPVSRRSVARLEAENGWRALGEAHGLPVAIIRLSGIYGPGRNGLRNVERGKARRIIKPGQVFNRIRVEDIGGATALLARNALGGVYNVTDDEPAPPQDVVSYAGALLGAELPPEIDFDDADMSPMARSFYGENKRVSNARIKQAGYAFRHPDYRRSLDQLHASKSWNDEA